MKSGPRKDLYRLKTRPGMTGEHLQSLGGVPFEVSGASNEEEALIGASGLDVLSASESPPEKRGYKPSPRSSVRRQNKTEFNNE